MFQLLFLSLFLGLAVWYLNTIANTIKAINYDNREISPMDIWYMLIPIVNYGFYFIMVTRVSKSIGNEFQSRNMNLHSRPAFFTGMMTAIGFICNAVISIVGKFVELPAAMGLIVIASFVFWIIYWVQITQYKRIIERFPLQEEVIEPTS